MIKNIDVILEGTTLGLETFKRALKQSCKAVKKDDINSYNFNSDKGCYQALLSRQSFILALPELVFYKQACFLGNLALNIINCVGLLHYFFNSNGSIEFEYVKDHFIKNITFFLAKSLSDLVSGFCCFIGVVNPLWIHNFAINGVFIFVKRLHIAAKVSITESQIKAQEYLIQQNWAESYLHAYEQGIDTIEFSQEKFNKSINAFIIK